MPTKRNAKSSARRPTIRGRGDYTSSTKSIPDPLRRVESKIDHLEKALVGNALSKNSAASLIGRTLGNLAGQGDLGAMAGSSLAKYFGHGDYTVKSNSLMAGGAAPRAVFSKDGRRGTRITEREFIGDVLAGPLAGASTEFTNVSFQLNPTDPATFPWLSRLAPLYDQWDPHGIVFEFVSTSSEFNGASQALGAVVMATDYDAFDPLYTTKQEMENADYACSTKPANGLVHGIECDKAERPTPLLFTSLDNGAPVTSTTLGRFQLATQGCSVPGVNLGELWVSYDITFYKKQLATTVSTAPFLNSAGTTVAGATYFPTTGLFRTITATQIIGTGTRIDLNNSTYPAKYFGSYFLDSGGNTDVVALTTGATLSNCTLSARSAKDPAGAFDTLVTYVITTTGPNASLLFPLNATVDSVYSFAIAQVPVSLTM